MGTRGCQWSSLNASGTYATLFVLSATHGHALPRALSASERVAEEAEAPMNRRTAFAAVLRGLKKHETAKRSDGRTECQ